MKALMYHYVREPRSELPYFTYLHRKDFIAQLRFLRSEFGFVDRDRFRAWVANPDLESEPPGVVLTFDDGFADHHQVVAPLLADLDAWGIFYVPTAVYTGTAALDVHRIHLLLGQLGGPRCLEILDTEAVSSMFPDEAIEEFQQATYVRQQSSDEATKIFKRMLNYYVDYDWRSQLLDRMILHAVPDQQWEALIAGLYMGKSELQDLCSAGNIIGSHSVTHRLMSKLTLDEQRSEIGESSAMLEELTGMQIETFCYPYGGFHSFTPDTERLLHEAGMHFSFNVEQRDIELTDVRDRPQALPRYDCNQFPHGSATIGSNRPTGG